MIIVLLMRLPLSGGAFKVLFIGFELQYHWGLTDITQEFRNRYFELGLRFYF